MLAIRYFELAFTPYHGFRLVAPRIRGRPTFYEGRPAKCMHIMFLNKPPDHAAPALSCTCGYYAWRLPVEHRVRGEVDLDVWGRDVLAIVEGYGKTIEHRMGYRFERMRIVGILASSRHLQAFALAPQDLNKWPWWDVADAVNSALARPLYDYITCDMRDANKCPPLLSSETHTPLDAIRILDGCFQRIPTGGAPC